MSSEKFEYLRGIAIEIMSVAVFRNFTVEYTHGKLQRGVQVRGSASKLLGGYPTFEELLTAFGLPDDAQEIDLVQAAGTFLYGNALNTNQRDPKAGLASMQKRLAADLDVACKWLKKEISDPVAPTPDTRNSRKKSGESQTFEKLPVNLGTALVPDAGRNRRLGWNEYDDTQVSMSGLVKILGAQEVARIFTANGLPVPLAAQTDAERADFGDDNPDDTIDKTRDDLNRVYEGELVDD